MDQEGEKRLQAAQRMADKCTNQFPEVLPIAAQELAALQARGEAVLVDVRTDAERAVSIIPGAVSVADFERLPVDSLSGKTCVPYCTVGFRSGVYARKLLHRKELMAVVAGVRNSEGIVLWAMQTQQGLVKPTGEGEQTLSVHTFGKTWALLDPARHDMVWFGRLQELVHSAPCLAAFATTPVARDAKNSG